jgi:hypothetical protein
MVSDVVDVDSPPFEPEHALVRRKRPAASEPIHGPAERRRDPALESVVIDDHSGTGGGER